MSRGPSFTEREVFEQMLSEIRAADGQPYRDIRTIYGDMARLVVAWLASTPPEEIIRVYNGLGWRGTANGRALHECARHWMRRFHPERTAAAGDASG